MLSSFRAICRKLFRKISEPTVGHIIKAIFNFSFQKLAKILYTLSVKGMISPVRIEEILKVPSEHVFPDGSKQGTYGFSLTLSDIGCT